MNDPCHEKCNEFFYHKIAPQTQNRMVFYQKIQLNTMSLDTHPLHLNTLICA